MLELDIEAHSDVEKRIKALLRDYRTMPAQIKLYERMSKGIGLIHEPRITAAPPKPDYKHLISEVAPLSETEQRIADAVQGYVITSTLGSRMQRSGRRGTESSQYITAARVARQLRGIRTDDVEQAEDYFLVEDAIELLDRRDPEERMELSDTERLAIQREPEIRRAKAKLEHLGNKYDVITYALDVMREYYEDLYRLLKFRYIDGNGWLDVCEEMSINGVAMTRKEYLNRRKEAMAEFARWCPLVNDDNAKNLGD